MIVDSPIVQTSIAPIPEVIADYPVSSVTILSNDGTTMRIDITPVDQVTADAIANDPKYTVVG